MAKRKRKNESGITDESNDPIDQREDSKEVLDENDAKQIASAVRHDVLDTFADHERVFIGNFKEYFNSKSHVKADLKAFAVQGEHCPVHMLSIGKKQKDRLTTMMPFIITTSGGGELVGATDYLLAAAKHYGLAKENATKVSEPIQDEVLLRLKLFALDSSLEEMQKHHGAGAVRAIKKKIDEVSTNVNPQVDGTNADPSPHANEAGDPNTDVVSTVHQSERDSVDPNAANDVELEQPAPAAESQPVVAQTAAPQDTSDTGGVQNVVTSTAQIPGGQHVHVHFHRGRRRRRRGDAQTPAAQGPDAPPAAETPPPEATANVLPEQQHEFEARLLAAVAQMAADQNAQITERERQILAQQQAAQVQADADRAALEAGQRQVQADRSRIAQEQAAAQQQAANQAAAARQRNVLPSLSGWSTARSPVRFTADQTRQRFNTEHANGSGMWASMMKHVTADRKTGGAFGGSATPANPTTPPSRPTNAPTTPANTPTTPTTTPPTTPRNPAP